MENILAEAEDNLAYDETELQRRLDSMHVKLDYINRNAKDSGNEEMKNALIRYSAIASNYKIFLEKQPVAIYDLEQFKNEFQKLKNELLEYKINEKEFEKKYLNLLTRLSIFERETRKLAYNTFSIETEFMRYDEIITAHYNKLKLQKQ